MAPAALRRLSRLPSRRGERCGRQANGREAEISPPRSAPERPRSGRAYTRRGRTLQHERISPRSDTVAGVSRRAERLAHHQQRRPPQQRSPSNNEGAPGRAAASGVVAGRSVLQTQLKGLGDLETVGLRAGDTADLDAVVNRLGEIGPTRGSIGHQAWRVRGGGGIPRNGSRDRVSIDAGGGGVRVRVLGRRDRGDPQLRRRRPAHHRPG